jgi:uncharacterized repeat protein (TIGR01451 family)
MLWRTTGRLGEDAGRGKPRVGHACLRGLAFRAGIATIGLLFVAVLTASAASAQTADLAITSYVDSPDPVGAGDSLTYTIMVINNGPNPATNVVVSSAPPANTKGTGLVCPGGWSGIFVGFPRGVSTCRIASLAVNAMATIQVNVLVNTDVALNTLITNTATITSTTVDPSGGQQQRDHDHDGQPWRRQFRAG